MVLSFFAIIMKTDFSSSVATAEFSKFAGIFSAALSQHHLLGFVVAQLEFHHLHYLCFLVMLSKAHLTSCVCLPMIISLFLPVSYFPFKFFFSHYLFFLILHILTPYK